VIVSAGEEIGVNGGLGGDVEDETVGHIIDILGDRYPTSLRSRVSGY
jgi:hypothetical protein